MKVLFIVSFAASLLMVGVGMIVALLPERVISLSGSLQDVGFLASAFALAYLLMQIPAGYLADRIGIKRVLLPGYLICVGSGVVFYFSTTPESLFIGRFVQGAGEAPIWALGPALLSQVYPNAKGKVIGIYNASIHIGLTIGPMLGIFLLLNSESRLPFLIFTLLCLSGAVLVMFWLPQGKVTGGLILGQIPSLGQLLRLLANRESVITLTGIILYGAGYGICISVLPATLALDKGFDQVSNSVFFTLFYLSISLAQLIIGPLSDRHGRVSYMVSGLLLAAIGFASFSLFIYPWIYFPLVVASIGLGIFCVASIAYLNECVPESLKSTISASYYLAWGSGYFLGPMLVGGIEGDYGFYMLAVLMSLAGISFYLVKEVKQ